MKINLFKKATSALLALVMCLSTFIGIGSTTAYAAGEKAEAIAVCSILGFKRKKKGDK